MKAGDVYGSLSLKWWIFTVIMDIAYSTILMSADIYDELNLHDLSICSTNVCSSLAVCGVHVWVDVP